MTQLNRRWMSSPGLLSEGKAHGVQGREFMGPGAPRAGHSLFDAVDGVAPPQALVVPCSPRQAVVLQSLPIFVEVFLL